MRRVHLAVVALGIVLMAGVAAQQRAEQNNMELVGSSDLQGRSAYQPVIHKQGSRWIAYVGHHGGVASNPLTGQRENNGTSIVDVTDPKQPRYLAHIPGDSTGQGEAGGAQMVRLCDGSVSPSWSTGSATRTRAGGNVRRASPISFPALPIGARTA